MYECVPIQNRSGVSFIQHLNVDRHLASSATENCILRLISLIIWRRNPRVYSIQADGAAPECGELSSARLSIRRARPGEAGGVTHLEAQLCPLSLPPIWLYRTITYAHVVQSIYYMSQYFNPNMYVLSTVCYACYAQDKKSPFLLSQNQE